MNYRRLIILVFSTSIIFSSALAQDLDAMFDGILSGMGESGAPTGSSPVKSPNKSAAKSIDDRFDAVLEGMGAKPQSKSAAPRSMADRFDAMLEGMGESPANASSSHRNDGDLFASVADAMSVNTTLDYLNGVYGAPLPSYSNNSFYRPAQRPNYAHLMPGGSVLPVIGRLTSNFGYRPKFGRMHKGVDIALQIGDTVRAAIDGTVIRVSNDPKGYGRFVCVQHSNGIETRYAHLSQPLVTAGERLYAGQPLGLGGNTGNSTGPHLHFETRVQGTAVDPTTMFDFNNHSEGYYRTRRDHAAPSLPAWLAGVAPEPDVMSAPGPYNTMQAANASAMTANGVAVSGGKNTYVVRTGDTIASIARRHGITVLKLCRLNMLSTTDVLQPGRMLKVR